MRKYQIEIGTNKIVDSNSSLEAFATANLSKYYLVESELLFNVDDIYTSEGNENTRKNAKIEILEQIAELELKQARPLRELRLNPTSEIAMNKITEIDTDIASLRAQYNALGAL